MSMCNVLCVTNRVLAGDRFLEQLRKVVQSGISGVVLREKDLGEQEYESLALTVLAICREADVPLLIHSHPEVASRLGIRRLHMPLKMFLSMTGEEKVWFDVIGVSTHSPEEAVQAWRAGASYVTAGHVFVTDCKKGLAPRGLDFLRRVCEAVDIPVYAIGGIAPENTASCLEAGASGICLMSSLMKAEDPRRLLDEYRL